jgi:hypothetical protein
MGALETKGFRSYLWVQWEKKLFFNNLLLFFYPIFSLGKFGENGDGCMKLVIYP